MVLRISLDSKNLSGKTGHYPQPNLLALRALMRYHGELWGSMPCGRIFEHPCWWAFATTPLRDIHGAKILNRRELRDESDSAERLGAVAEPGQKVEDEKRVAKKAAAKPRKSRSKTPKEVRLKAFWGVFSQSLAQVAQYEYGQRPDADKRATELTESKKSPHFVQLVKKVIEE